MTAWRRVDEPSPRLRGAVSRRGLDFFGEEVSGRVVATAVFRREPRAGQGAPARLVVQARDGVVIRVRRTLEDGEHHVADFPHAIALAASGGHPDRFYLWVQMYSHEPERITDRDGRARVEDIVVDEERPTLGPEAELTWARRRWAVDNNQTDTARYSLSQPTFASPNCETLYDAPTTELALARWLREHSAIRVTKTIQFQSFLYEVPLRPEDRSFGFLARADPAASVAWSFDEVLARDQGGAPRVLEKRYRVHYIHPNGVTPPALRSRMFRLFHGR